MVSNGHKWLVCTRTKSSLTSLDRVLERALAAEEPQLRQITLDLILQGGKRLRPSLLFLAAAYGQFLEVPLLRAAAAQEMLHVASLCHDDVMDRAPTRRGGASINTRWGNGWATLAGTFLFARASALLASLGDTVNWQISQAVSELCTGQLQEVENSYNLELTEDEHLEILARKTATLFELPCRLGAHLSGASQAHTDALASYGHHLGLAFQLTDDVLDLSKETSQLGKATGTDLREGVYSLPVLRALRQQGATGERLRWLLERERLTEEDLREVLGLVHGSGVVAEAREVARERARRAQAALEVLPEGPARTSLFRLADYAATREMPDLKEPFEWGEIGPKG
jgi:geranylgeranyl pyrophosphate synthase